MSLKGRLRCLAREAKGNGIILRLKDGTTRVFDTLSIQKELFLTKMDLLRETSRESEVLDAVRNATPESRREFEERFEPITMSTAIISDREGWVATYTLTEEGAVEKTFHKRGSEEAERIRPE